MTDAPQHDYDNPQQAEHGRPLPPNPIELLIISPTDTLIQRLTNAAPHASIHCHHVSRPAVAMRHFHQLPPDVIIFDPQRDIRTAGLLLSAILDRPLGTLVPRLVIQGDIASDADHPLNAPETASDHGATQWLPRESGPAQILETLEALTGYSLTHQATPTPPPASPETHGLQQPHNAEALHRAETHDPGPPPLSPPAAYPSRRPPISESVRSLHYPEPAAAPHTSAFSNDSRLSHRIDTATPPRTTATTPHRPQPSLSHVQHHNPPSPPGPERSSQLAWASHTAHEPAPPYPNTLATRYAQPPTHPAQQPPPQTPSQLHSGPASSVGTFHSRAQPSTHHHHHTPGAQHFSQHTSQHLPSSPSFRATPSQQTGYAPSHTPLSNEAIRVKLRQVRHEDYFNILNLPKGAAGDRIAQAHSTLTERYHPTRVPQPLSDQYFYELREICEALDDARLVLSIPELRDAYLRTLIGSG